MAKTRFFRIAVEGATATDGRTITREMIDQSATGYNTVTYTARINCEHLRGFSPEPPFNAYGSVIALKAEDFEIEIDGKKQTRRALYGQFDANDQMVATVKADQKIFTSCEFQPDFAKTGKFGLVGLAITDNPASLGTEALKFSAFKPMWDARKTDPTNFFSAAEENLFALEVAPAPADPSGVTAAITAGFAAVASMFKREEPKQAAPEPKPPANDNFDPAAFATTLGQTMATQLNAALQPLMAAQTQFRTEFDALTTRLSTTEVPNNQPRQLSTGGDTAIVTDC